MSSWEKIDNYGDCSTCQFPYKKKEKLETKVTAHRSMFWAYAKHKTHS